jgi:hypothetical protein
LQVGVDSDGNIDSRLVRSQEAVLRILSAAAEFPPVFEGDNASAIAFVIDVVRNRTSSRILDDAGDKPIGSDMLTKETSDGISGQSKPSGHDVATGISAGPAESPDCQYKVDSKQQAIS